MCEPWKTDKWFVSPWNYDLAARNGKVFSKDIKIHDVTLRDGEQQTGVVFRRAEKVEIAKRLAAMGVHRIEAGMPAVSEQDRAAICDIANLGLKSEIFSFARCMVQDVRAAKECGCTGVVVEIPSSEHIIRNAYGWDLERAVKSSIEATLAAKEAGLYTVFFTIDSTRTEVSRLFDMIEQVAEEGHMDAFTLADSFGGCTPEAVYNVVKAATTRLKCPIEIHCHQDFGLGVANTLSALQAGATVAHTTVTGLGERAGNVPMEDVVLSLLCLFGIDVGLRTEQMCELSRFVLQAARVPIPGNRPIVGDMLYQVESGIVAGFVRRARAEHPLEYVPFSPELVGQQPVSIVLGKKSGLPSVQEWCEGMHVTATEDQMLKMLKHVKDMSFEKKGLLTRDEFAVIANSVLAQEESA